jgi:hypothetical protein
VVHHAEVVMSSCLRDTGTTGQAVARHAEAEDLVEVHHAGVDDVPVHERHRRMGCWVVDDHP